ncbi:unnamed protein product [Kuraishia capsulata CBS 1993]|uniref:Uncharacterized protein n=1 Tax=Kuraishia capsulata CBS 1993 TaxID=1382522 RepID=W6MK62_9ASCO|nr:uncharacterized protein KUCA_T00002685001 [Kuraishia capsulata CBS 1993]CDK26711.1 unnamed protein product [Kuraishia capsulata CBS 1993]
MNRHRLAQSGAREVSNRYLKSVLQHHRENGARSEVVADHQLKNFKISTQDFISTTRPSEAGKLNPKKTLQISCFSNKNWRKLLGSTPSVYFAIRVSMRLWSLVILFCGSNSLSSFLKAWKK